MQSIFLFVGLQVSALTIGIFGDNETSLKFSAQDIQPSNKNLFHLTQIFIQPDRYIICEKEESVK